VGCFSKKDLSERTHKFICNNKWKEKTRLPTPRQQVERICTKLKELLDIIGMKELA